MMRRKHGVTNKQFIQQLQQKIDTKDGIISQQARLLDELCRKENVVPMETFLQMEYKYLELVNRLKYYNLWTGE